MSAIVRRSLDLAVGFAALVALSPVFLLVATSVVLDSGLPILFRQTRIGRGGRPFVLLKFRTMRATSDTGAQLTVRGDPRITRVGRFLRRSKLDELPQFVNVLRGEMTLVGPRPEVPQYVVQYPPQFRCMLDLKPGLTDPATLAYINEEDQLARLGDVGVDYVREVMPRKLAANLEYAGRATIVTDLEVIAQTAFLVIKRTFGFRKAVDVSK